MSNDRVERQQIIRIDLTWAEMFTACTVGVVRRLSSMNRGYNKNKHAEISNFQTDIDGAIGEACFAKFRDHYWSCTVNTFKEPDVADWQVRATSWSIGHLIIRPDDEDHYRVAFLTTEGFGANLHGWFGTAEAKVERYWRAAKNGWWVPQQELHRFDEFGDWTPSNNARLRPAIRPGNGA